MREIIGGSAKDDGFFMPAEWHPHSRCWMAWPCRSEVWGEDFALAETAYARIASSIVDFEPVTMLAGPEQVQRARVKLDSRVEILELPIDDSWVRDNGPNFLIDRHGRLAASGWRFNAWGQKYSPFEQDAAVARSIAEILDVDFYNFPLTAEGGGISVDGEGTVLTTEQCLLNSNRNPGWNKAEVEAMLCASLGVEKVIWLPGDPEDDETDGHVDGLAAFVRPGLVLVQHTLDKNSRRFEIHRANIEALEGERDARGRPLNLVFIEEAHEAETWGPTFCLSYLNSYLANGAVIMPSYGTPGDRPAKEVYEDLYPDRTIVQVPIRGVAVGGGGIHCITQQQPLV